MKNKISREKELETIISIVAVLVILYLITKRHYSFLLWAAVATGLIATLSKVLTSKIVWGWMKFSELLGSVTSKILLTLVFFCFLWPIAALSRMFDNKSNLQLRKTSGPSYFVTRNHKYEATDLENGW